MDTSSKETFKHFTQELKKANTGQTTAINLKYISGEANVRLHKFSGQLIQRIINCCHINTFLAILHLGLSHYNTIPEFIAEAKSTRGLHLGKIFEDIEYGEFDRARSEWVQIADKRCLSNPGPILDLAGKNWEWTAGCLELSRFRHHKHACALCDYSTPFIKLTSDMLSENDDPLLQEVINIYCRILNHILTSIKRTGSCSIIVTNGAPLILFISLEEIASQMNIAGIPMDLFIFGYRYKFLSVSLGVLPPKGIGHITGLMHLCPDFIHYDGLKEYPLERVTSAAQLKYTGIYLAIYIRDGLSSNQWSNDSPTLLEKIQEYKINTSLPFQ